MQMAHEEGLDDATDDAALHNVEAIFPEQFALANYIQALMTVDCMTSMMQPAPALLDLKCHQGMCIANCSCATVDRITP